MLGSRSAGLILVALTCVLVSCAHAEKVTATTDYGFGPLWIDFSTEGETLQRCDNVTINLGGGFGPYYLAAVNAANKSTTINLKTNTSASWKIELSEDSHVAFNVTDRAGATLQTDFLTVQASANGKTCGNDTAYKEAPTPTPGSSGASRIDLSVFTAVAASLALASFGLMPFSV